MNTKALIFCLSLLVVTISVAQKTKAELVFKDGTVLTGLGEPTTIGNIRFRKERKAKKEFYSFEQVDTLKVYYDFEPTIFVQEYIKERTNPKVLELAHVGKNVAYYREVSQGYMAPSAIPAAGGGTMLSSPGGFYSIKKSYVRKTGEEEATYLGSSNWMSKNFKKAASSFFQDCPALVKKIENRELRKRDLREIIEFYNNQCD